MNKAIFLDRDWVLNYDSNYAHKIEDLIVLPWVREWLHLLKDAWYKLIVVSNQSWIGRWYYTLEDFSAFTYELAKEVDIKFDAICCCPHHPSAGCECRKPKAGMVLAIAEELNIDLTQSRLIGDKESDIQCWKNAGCKTILIGDDDFWSDYRCLTLLDAADIIIGL